MRKENILMKNNLKNEDYKGFVIIDKENDCLKLIKEK